MDKATWQNMWKAPDCYGRVGNLGTEYDNDGNEYEGWRWIEGREIRVFSDPSMPNRCINAVKRVIKGMISDVGLKLKLRSYTAYNEDPSITGPVRDSIQNGYLDGDKLSRYFMAEEYRIGDPPADVYIGNMPIVLGGENWGQSRFSMGAMVMALTPGYNNPEDDRNRQDRDFVDLIERISKHETGHLLGYQQHHEQFDVDGYEEPEDCVMYWDSSTSYLCDKCGDAMKSFWEGLEEETNKRFFKVKARRI